MSYTIIFINTLSVLGLFATAMMGYGLSDALGLANAPSAVATAFSRHFVLALIFTLCAIFGQSMTFFYFIGTGKSIKAAVQMYDLDPKYAHETRLFKQQTSGPAFLALMCVMAAFVIGGGVATRAVPSWVHHLLAWSALLVHGYASFVGARVIRTNVARLAELDRIVKKMTDAGEVEAKGAYV